MSAHNPDLSAFRAYISRQWKPSGKSTSTSAGKSETVLVSLWSDIHYGHVQEQPEYGPDMAKEHMSRYGEAIIDLLRVYQARHHYALLLGDLVEGEARGGGQWHHIAMPAIEQAMHVARILRSVFARITRATGVQSDLHVVPGNHGRTTIKADVAALSELGPEANYDWLIGHLVKDARLLGYREEEDVSRDSHGYRVHVHGYAAKVQLAQHMGAPLIAYLEHGSGFKGASVSDAQLLRLFATEAADGRVPHLFVFGHFHEFFYKHFYGAHIVQNGAMCPATDFGKFGVRRPSPPLQVVLVFACQTERERIANNSHQEQSRPVLIALHPVLL